MNKKTLYWKNEGLVGPITICEPGESPFQFKPWTPDAPDSQWYTRKDAMVIAKEHGAEFEEI